MACPYRWHLEVQGLIRPVGLAVPRPYSLPGFPCHSAIPHRPSTTGPLPQPSRYGPQLHRAEGSKGELHGQMAISRPDRRRGHRGAAATEEPLLWGPGRSFVRQLGHQSLASLSPCADEGKVYPSFATLQWNPADVPAPPGGVGEKQRQSTVGLLGCDDDRDGAVFDVRVESDRGSRHMLGQAGG